MAQLPTSSTAASLSPSLTTDIPSLSSPWVVTSDNIRPAKPLLLHELLALLQTNPTHLTNKSIRLIAQLHSYNATTDTATLGPPTTSPSQCVAVWMGLMGGSWRCGVGGWCQVIGECEWEEVGGLVVHARVVRELDDDWDMKLYESVVHSRRAWEKRIGEEPQQQREAPR